MSNLVDNAPLRAEYVRACENGMNPTVICRGLGWAKADGRQPRMSQLRRALGIEPEANGHIRMRITYENAVKIAREIGADPVDVGI